MLHIVSPYALHGSFPLPSSSWGGPEGGEIPCGPPEGGGLLTFGLSGSDSTLCQYDMRKMKEGETWTNSDVVFARRGVCGMVDKAKFASHGGAGAMILVNNEPKALSEIPKGPVATNDINQRGTGVYSVGGLYGSIASEAILNVPSLHHMEGYIGCKNSENAMLPSAGAVTERDRDNTGGRIYVVGGRGGHISKAVVGYGFGWAAFGPSAGAGGPFVDMEGGEGGTFPSGSSQCAPSTAARPPTTRSRWRGRLLSC
jgi:hypothetical protein